MENELLARLGYVSLTGTVAVLLVLFANRTLPRLPGAVRAWLWWLVCLKFLLDLVALPLLPFAFPTHSSLPAPIAALTPTVSQPSEPQPVTTPTPSQTEANQVVSSSNKGGTEVTPVLVPALLDWQRYVALLLLGLWLIGIGIEVGRQWQALAQLQRLLAQAQRHSSPVLTDAAKRAGLRTVPTLWALPLAVEPLTVGFRRPGIVLSEADLAQLSDADLLPILTHECIHLRRGDLLLALVPWLARALFWFFPPVYLAAREFELAREIACDQQTVAALAVAPRSYGELLVKLSSSPSALSAPSSAIALSAGFRYLKRRIEMLEIKPYRRRLLLPVLLVGAGILLPWRLTQGAPPPATTSHAKAVVANGTPVVLPNLNFAQGLKNWRKMANGSDTQAHPFYTVGFDPQVTRNRQHAGFVQARANIAKDLPGDGGVLRYDTDAAALRGKRLRLSGLIHGVGIQKQAFLLIVPESETGLSFAASPPVTKANTGWEQRTCVIDVPADAVALIIGIRLEGGGRAYLSNVALDIVDKTVPLSPIQKTAYPAAETPPPANLDFRAGLDAWWNDNPTHTAAADYTLWLEPTGGQKHDPAASLKNKVAAPKSYGTIAQNASAIPYRGKHVRLSALLKSENATLGGLWYVLHDQDPAKSTGDNYHTSNKNVHGTQPWTEYTYDFDVSPTADILSFGISSDGPGTIWVNHFSLTIVPAATKP